MSLSQKCQYAVRAILELSMQYGSKAVSAGDIAERQAVPRRFLEIILNELKPSGLLDSRRGKQGGYYLTVPPDQITVGSVIRLVDGPLEPVRCTGDAANPGCPLMDCCCLIELWAEAREAVEKVYDGITFATLVERRRKMEQPPLDYCI